MNIAANAATKTNCFIRYFEMTHGEAGKSDSENLAKQNTKSVRLEIFFRQNDELKAGTQLTDWSKS